MQGEDPLHDLPHFSIRRNQTFRVQFAERHMESALFSSHLPQAIQRQVDTFTDADSGSAEKQEGICVETTGSEQFLLQPLILLRGKRSGEIAGSGRQVFRTNEAGLQRIALGSLIVQQPAERYEVIESGWMAQRRLFFTQPAEPAEQMRIAAQLRELAKVREMGAEITEKAARDKSIVVYRAGLKGQGECPDLSFEDLFQDVLALSHER